MLVNAVMNSGMREDSTRIGSGGTIRRQAVDVSPLRRVNTAIFRITTRTFHCISRWEVRVIALTFVTIHNRQVNTAIFLLTTGAREASFRSIKTIAECLADELINAAKGSSNSYAIKKKDEVERVAKANR